MVTYDISTLISDRAVVMVRELKSDKVYFGIIIGQLSDELVRVQTRDFSEPIEGKLPLVRVFKDSELNDNLKLFQRSYHRECLR